MTIFETRYKATQAKNKLDSDLVYKVIKYRDGYIVASDCNIYKNKETYGRYYLTPKNKEDIMLFEH